MQDVICRILMCATRPTKESLEQNLHSPMGMQNMVEARNANYATISRHLCFGKRGSPNADTEGEAQGKPERSHASAETLDNGSDSDTETPEPKLLRVSVAVSKSF